MTHNFAQSNCTGTRWTGTGPKFFCPSATTLASPDSPSMCFRRKSWGDLDLESTFSPFASQVSDPQRRPCSRHLCEGQPEQSHQGYQGSEFPWNDPEKWPWKMALKNDPEKWPRKWPWKLILGEEEQCGEKQLLSPVQPVLPLQVAGGAAGHLLPQHLSLWGGI